MAKFKNGNLIISEGKKVTIGSLDITEESFDEVLNDAENYIDSRDSLTLSSINSDLYFRLGNSRTVTSDSTAESGEILLVDASLGNVTISLTPENNARVTIKKIDASENQVGINSITGLIEELTTITLENQYDCVSIICDGTDWWVTELKTKPVLVDFISSWDTTKYSEYGDRTIALPLFNGGTYNFTVDYGDSSGIKTVTAWNDADATHIYEVNGTYTVTIKGQIEGFLNFGDDAWYRNRLVGISNWGTLKVGTNQGGYFTLLKNLVVTATDILDMSAVTSMGLRLLDCGMFQSCWIFNGSVAGWDTSNVTSMYSVFWDCRAFNQPLTGWDTSNVTDMGYMFGSCSVFNQSVANFDTSNVTNMSYMFENCTAFDQSLASWDVSNVTTMGNMFLNANAWSQANYDATLIAWSALTLKSNVQFHAGDATYSTGAATTARGVLTGTYGWTITDGGQN
jgi:surface protein